MNSVIPLEFSAVLVKGRGNYLSLRRLDNALSRAGGLFHDEEESTSSAGSATGRDGRPTARWPIWTSARCPPSGTRWPATTATAWAGSARTTPSASTTRPGGGCRTPRSWWSTTPCSSPTWLCGASRSASCPITTSVIFDEAHTIEAVAGDHLGLSSHQRAGRVRAAEALQRPDQPRAAGASQAERRPETGLGVPGAGERFLRQRRSLARRAAGRQRPRA